MITDLACETIVRLEYDLVEAFIKGDTARLAEILADEFMITDPNGSTFSKASFISLIAAGKVAFYQLAISTLDVRITDNIAQVSGSAFARGHSDQGNYDGEYRFLDVFVNRQGRWQAILSAVDIARMIA